ncbi:hypothetical protein BKI52_26520 [marine bacterium AO1-C]|nr:hypothetical protein BKI52_26520 [marine bacterium AO1-C]
MLNRYLNLLVIALLLFLCSIVPAQASPNIDKLTGIWVRKDIIQTLQKTQSFFQTKKYAENQPFTELTAVGINYDPKNYYRLSIGFTQFGAPYMPASVFLNTSQKPTTLGYRLGPSSIYQNYTFHLSIKKGELWVHVQKGSLTKQLVFKKMAQAPTKVLYSKLEEAQRQIIKGSYELRDENNRLIQSHVWFDSNGLTSFPGLYRYDLRGGYWNSIHESHNAYKIKTSSLDSLQALDQEDILFLYNQGDSFMNKKQFALKKVHNGFEIYALKEREVRMHQLLYKAKLQYRLIKKW